MSCDDLFLDIWVGEYREIIAHLKDENGNALDISAATNVKARFKKTDGTVLEKTSNPAAGVTVLSGGGGKIKIILAVADTDVLKVEERGSFEVVVDFPSTQPRVIPFYKVLNVKKRLV